MARVVNRHGAPASLVAFANAPHYDSGDSDITVTQLIDAPRIRILRDKHADQIQDDVYENIFRLVGTAIHSIAEQHPGGMTTEERIHIRVGGKNVSGAIDVQYMNEDGLMVIGDYKFTSIYSLKHPEKFENQLNLYCYLLEHRDSPPDHDNVGELEVYAILRDWSWRKAEREVGYPKTPGVTVKINLWERERQHEYLLERFDAHRAADTTYELGGDIPPCTKEEMWEKDPTFAVRSGRRDKTAAKKGTKGRAVRVFSDAEEADAYAEDDEDLSVEFRAGERTRCENFCDVAQFCNQWREYSGEEDETD